VGAIVGLVEQENQMLMWNQLMIREHPQGDGPLVGRQIRYLVLSAHGWLGGLGFAGEGLSRLGLNQSDRRSKPGTASAHYLCDSAQRTAPGHPAG
jgi:hypothetical protein